VTSTWRLPKFSTDLSIQVLESAAAITELAGSVREMTASSAALSRCARASRRELISTQLTGVAGRHGGCPNRALFSRR